MDVAKQLFLIAFRMEGINLERLMNLAGEKGILLKDLNRRGLKTVDGACNEADYKKLSELAGERGWKLTRLKHRRLSAVKNWLKRRFAVGLGIVLCVALAITAMRLVWSVDILDAGPYESEVRVYLREKDIRPGRWKQDISLEEIVTDLEWRLPKVAWVQAYYRGTAIVVRCILGVPPPGIVTQGGPGDVVAKRDGIIVSILPLAGTAACKPGDLVRAGQVLISGWEKGTGGSRVAVKARGIAIAKFWVGARVRIPVDEVISTPTGRETVTQAVETPWFTWGDLAPPDFLKYDKTIEIWPVCGAWWPVSLRRETCAEVELSKKARDEAEVKAEAGVAVLRALGQKLLPGHEPVDKWVDYCMIEGRMMEATAICEIRADIALLKPWQAGAAP